MRLVCDMCNVKIVTLIIACRQVSTVHNNFLHQQLLHVFQELPTPGGGEPLAQTTLTLNWSTLEELEEPIIMPEEDQRKEFAYHTTLTTSQAQSASLPHR